MADESNQQPQTATPLGVEPQSDAQPPQATGEPTPQQQAQPPQPQPTDARGAPLGDQIPTPPESPVVGATPPPPEQQPGTQQTPDYGGFHNPLQQSSDTAAGSESTSQVTGTPGGIFDVFDGPLTGASSADVAAEPEPATSRTVFTLTNPDGSRKVIELADGEVLRLGEVDRDFGVTGDTVVQIGDLAENAAPDQPGAPTVDGGSSATAAHNSADDTL